MTLTEKSLYETSSALKANLLETAVTDVTIDPAKLALLDMIKDFKGIHNNLYDLLYEIHHPYRNWNLIIPKLRTFVLKNVALFCRSDKGPEAFSIFCGIFLQAIDETRKNRTLLNLCIESMLAYVERLISSARADLQKYESVLSLLFDSLYSLDNPIIMLVVQGHHPMKKIVLSLVEWREKEGISINLQPAARLMKKILLLNYNYWLEVEDPLPWFLAQCSDMCNNWDAGKLFNAISHDQIRKHLERLQEIEVSNEQRDLRAILELPSHMDLVRLYREIPEKLAVQHEKGAKPEDDRFSENRKLIFLFRIMRTSGLYLIHEESLREINRSLIVLIRQQTFEEIESFLLTTLQLLKENVRRYPHTALQCIQVLGTEVFNRENSRLVETFLWETVRFGFQYANVTGVDQDWQPITNPAHLANIRVWLNLIMQEPKWCSTLFSALIINLKLSGTCVKDTDLFQRDISRLLNHPIAPVYNLVKQFTKLMPVFFNEIGAEGNLRDVSTELDEIHKRKDLLMHFLRKQSHVESSNLIVDFIKAILRFWLTLDKQVLKDFLPDEVLSQVQTSGPFVDEQHIICKRLKAIDHYEKESDLLKWEEGKIIAFLVAQKDISPHEVRRFELLVQMYRLLDLKYNLGFQELRRQLEQAAGSGFPEMEQLLADLEICDTVQCLTALLDHLEQLKAIILSSTIFEAKEDIYYKRHIAVDIPSVYGRYSERKFDALGLTFRLENLANIYLERLPSSLNLSFITRATFIRIIKYLRLYLRALKIDGIISRRLETYVALLSNSLGIKRFSYTQYIDIFRGLSEGVKDVIYAYYTNLHQNNLSIIIPQIGSSNLLAKYRNLWEENENDKNGQSLKESIHRLSEAFMRDLISSTFGLQHLDNFITRIYQVLERQRELLDEKQLDLLMTYNPDKAIHEFDRKSAHAKNLILLGNKGFNLSLLASDNKPVPPGFIITTEIFRCWPVVSSFYMARNEFMKQIRHALNKIEEKTGTRYGDPDNPLLVSIRSGASISMPGMMATIHNVGLNNEIVEAVAEVPAKEYLAWDNYRRFLQSWGMTMGVARDIFQALMNEAKSKHGVRVKSQFSPAQMKELALSYQKKIRNLGIGIPDDPWLQLIGAIEMVLASWDTPKTKGYRGLMGISHAWGTAAIVQAMVFGNLGPESGSGVVFTAHPYRKVRRVALWGDYAPGDQGEDIVSGLVTTFPISVEQAEIDGRPMDFSLETRSPEVYQELLSIARNLVYEKEWNPQEIEFTFEGPKASDLYILQTRDMITIKKKERFYVFQNEDQLADYILGKGIGVSGSALSGLAVFNEKNVRDLREKHPDMPLILIRQDTVPEDVKEIAMADGLLTSRGGQTSHASVVALRLEKTCVVGCHALQVYEAEERCVIGGRVIRLGDPVAIDGRKGLFLHGLHEVKVEVHILPI
ncbi:MAG: phosphoenolpyruvate synthase [Proteobacteria bacterium]|nr:phosphoenolpyruvate synthase [Pseudomonadota bacterium]MBU4296935.1 phosphoenolpyruvate synthase [Pseudomonadota bacterium]MCG2746097.1 phosphoenolpyruvate synthase [Desulfobulbaceae bacterium]